MKRKPYMNFNIKYPKLCEDELRKNDGKFTTIRTYASEHFYPLGRTVDVTVNSEYLYEAKISGRKRIRKDDITESLAWADSNITAAKLKNLLTRIHTRHQGADYDDYLVITLKRVEE